MSATKTFPSLAAFKASKGGPAVAKAAAASDPLEHLYENHGLWLTGAVQDYRPMPLPETAEIKSRVEAKALAAKGGRPFAEADPELIAMFAPFYAEKHEDGKAREMPDALKAALAALPKPGKK